MQQQHGTRNKVLRYQEKRREEKKIHKKINREWEKEAEELQDLYYTMKPRKFYSEVQETKKEFKPRVNMCKAKDGSIICDQNEVLTRWNAYFNDLLNKNNN
jgi:ferredoxin-NADP reductase